MSISKEAFKMTVQRGDFAERAVELYFNAEDNLILRILPKNKDQWEYCPFTKDEAIEFMEAFKYMLAIFEDVK